MGVKSWQSCLSGKNSRCLLNSELIITSCNWAVYLPPVEIPREGLKDRSSCAFFSFCGCWRGLRLSSYLHPTSDLACPKPIVQHPEPHYYFSSDFFSSFPTLFKNVWAMAVEMAVALTKPETLNLPPLWNWLLMLEWWMASSLHVGIEARMMSLWSLNQAFCWGLMETWSEGHN